MNLARPALLFASFASMLLGVANAPGQSPDTTAHTNSRKAVRGPEVLTHRPYEYEDGQTGSVDNWSHVPDGVQVSLVSTDRTFLRHQVPQLKMTHVWSATAWRGERVNLLAVAWCKTRASQVRCRVISVTGPDDSRLPVDIIRVRFVRYVLSNLPVGSMAGTCDEADLSRQYLVPDVLDNVDRLDIAARSVRPVWMTLDVPGDAAPGDYKVTLELLADGGIAISLAVHVEVQKGIVPQSSQWRTRVDFWQNPWAVAAYHGVEPWSGEHLSLLRPLLALAADNGARYVTGYICWSPWQDATHVPEQTMVEWIKNLDGSWAFDYTHFDEYVQLGFDCGLQYITLYTMLPWQHRVRWQNADDDQYQVARWEPGSKQFNEFWAVFLKDLRSHLIERGWFDRTYFGLNENNLQDTLVAIETLRRDSQQWKITYAGEWHAELNENITDYSILINHAPGPERLRSRRSQGRTTTFYVCCQPARPNNFAFSPPAENAWMGWFAVSNGYDGFLRWSWENWTADPLRDVRHTRWPAGDCFLVYPGPRSSIRLEKLREGFVDFEKVHVLRQRLQRRHDSDAVAALGKLEKVLKQFRFNGNATDVETPVREGRSVLNEISKVAFP